MHLLIANASCKIGQVFNCYTPKSKLTWIGIPSFHQKICYSVKKNRGISGRVLASANCLSNKIAHQKIRHRFARILSLVEFCVTDCLCLWVHQKYHYGVSNTCKTCTREESQTWRITVICVVRCLTGIGLPPSYILRDTPFDDPSLWRTKIQSISNKVTESTLILFHQSKKKIWYCLIIFTFHMELLPLRWPNPQNHVSN